MILAPVKPEEAVRKLEDMNPGCPVILLGQSPDEGTALDTIGADGREIGRLLGEAAASQAPRDVPVYLFCGGLDYGDMTFFAPMVCVNVQVASVLKQRIRTIITISTPIC